MRQKTVPIPEWMRSVSTRKLHFSWTWGVHSPNPLERRTWAETRGNTTSKILRHDCSWHEREQGICTRKIRRPEWDRYWKLDAIQRFWILFCRLLGTKITFFFWQTQFRCPFKLILSNEINNFQFFSLVELGF